MREKEERIERWKGGGKKRKEKMICEIWESGEGEL